MLNFVCNSYGFHYFKKALKFPKISINIFFQCFLLFVTAKETFLIWGEFHKNVYFGLQKFLKMRFG